jgi:hypothetical protein
MTLPDIYRLANANLWRTKLRTALTTLGVIVGTGALVSMLSFGIGIQKNVTDELKKNDLFTTLEVTRTKVNVQEMMAGDMSAIVAPADTTTPPLDDAAVEKIRNLPGVEMAYPEIRFPAKIRLGSREMPTNVQALPAAMVRYKPFSEVPYGSFFSTDDDRSVILGQHVLRGLGMRIDDPKEPETSRLGEKELEGTVAVSPDSILGRDLVIVTSVLDASNVLSALMTGGMPVREEVTTLKVAGILGKPTGFGVGGLAGGVIIPSGTAQAIPRLGFSNVWELLSSSGNAPGYPSVSVRAKSMRDLEKVRAGVEVQARVPHHGCAPRSYRDHRALRRLARYREHDGHLDSGTGPRDRDHESDRRERGRHPRHLLRGGGDDRIRRRGLRDPARARGERDSERGRELLHAARGGRAGGPLLHALLARPRGARVLGGREPAGRSLSGAPGGARRPG